jgi:hypothetical protein
MRRAAVLLTMSAAGLTPAAADAATIGLEPAKPCYLEGEAVTVRGGGFSPNAGVGVAVDGTAVGRLPTDPAGNLAGQFQVGQADGVQTRTLAATDEVNPALTASAQYSYTELTVRVTPSGGSPNRRRTVRATGFLTGQRLYSHAVRRGYRRTASIGRLDAPCGSLTARARLFSRRAPVGKYRVQFDTSRRYDRGTPGRVIFNVRVYRRPRSSAAGASTAQRWTLVGAVR